MSISVLATKVDAMKEAGGEQEEQAKQMEEDQVRQLHRYVLVKKMT